MPRPGEWKILDLSPDRLIVLTMALMAAVCLSAFAQTELPVDTLVIRKDSIEVRTDVTYDLDEIFVGSGRASSQAVGTAQKIGLAEIDRADAPNVAGILRLLPAAAVQTNSRGETLIYLRGSSERQVSVFLNGALLNVPWDQRVDLSILPGNMIGGATTYKGLSSVLFGTNVSGGAVNMTTRHYESEGRITEASVHAGAPFHTRASLMHLGRNGAFDYSAALGVVNSHGASVPSDADLQFGQTGSSIRTNTDLSIQNGFLRFGYQRPSGSKVALTFMSSSSSKGVASEGHEAAGDARYWRYPDSSTNMAILSGEALVGSGKLLDLKASLWVSGFEQQIDAYEDDTYSGLETQQYDQDLTVGARVSAERRIGLTTLQAAINIVGSGHQQRQVDFENKAAAEVEEQFQQTIASGGLQLNRPVGRGLSVNVGMTLDGTSTNALDRDESDILFAPGFLAGLVLERDGSNVFRAAVGRKSRFPTMREKFDTGLGRFVVNPDLTQENTTLVELGVSHAGETLSADLVLFGSLTDDAIDQGFILVNGEDSRARINLEGSRVFGVELAGGSRLSRALRLDGHVTYIHGRAWNADTEKYDTYLAERPDLLGKLFLTFQRQGILAASLEGFATGTAFSEISGGTFVKLPAALQLNAKVSRRFFLANSATFSAEVFARIDNIFDTVVLPQLGLPEAGRTVVFGLKCSI